MSTFYSASTGGFYDSDINSSIPPDAVEITGEGRSELIDAQASGKIIRAGVDGRPIAIDPPPVTLPEARAIKIAEINTWKDRERETFEWDGHAWDSDVDGRSNIMGVIIAGIAPPSGYWTSADNVDVPIATLEDMQAMYGAMVSKAAAVHDRQRAMKLEVEAMADVAAVLAYPVGW